MIISEFEVYFWFFITCILCYVAGTLQADMRKVEWRRSLNHSYIRGLLDMKAVYGKMIYRDQRGRFKRHL